MAAKKSGLLKKIVIAAASLALLGFVGLAVAIKVVNWNALKDKGAAYLSQTLHHKVTIGSIEPGFFSVKISKIKIANAAGFGEAPLFYNEEAKLSISPLSLLMFKLVVSEIEFKSPDLFIAKDARGKFNFSDMSSSSASAGSESKPGSAPNILINSFRLTAGDLV